ncbi:MAG: hypothetical protein DRP09_21110 [Candidatus Thorarchaeota archaeon]|nr:MAG: hypothetical protein DRP09_21110 [Candidatus Thorarchaeota archaeon]
MMQNLLSQLKESKKKKTMFQLGAALMAALLAIIILLVAKPKRPTRKTYFTQIKTQKEDLTKESWLATATEQLEKQSKQIEELKRQLERLKFQSRSTSQPVMPVIHGKQQPESRTKSQPLHTPPYTAPPPPPPPAAEKKEIKPELMTDLIEVVKPQGDKTQAHEPTENPHVEKKKEIKKPLTVDEAIPAGASATGILLTGLDAPTGGKAQSNPHPVEVLITDYTILPNEFKSDLKGCFVLGEGYGDLSSERAYIRLTLLSCVKEDGEIIQKEIDAYLSGEDGKAGLKGRVVSKQGALLARTLVAGFLEGAAQAMQQQGMIISISPLGQTQTISPSEVGKVAAYSGAGKAAEKLADFYMKLVNETFPVVEINAGRKVDVVFLKEVRLFEDKV